MSNGRLIDIAQAMMSVIEQVDANESEKARAIRHRVTALTMRRVGYGDEDIVKELGYLPIDPRERQVEMEPEAQTMPTPGR